MRLARLVTVVWFSSVGLSMEHGIYLRMCPPCDRVEPETWPVSLSMAPPWSGRAAQTGAARVWAAPVWAAAAAPITIHHGRGAQLSWPTNHEIVIHWIDIRRTLHIQESLSSIQLVRPRPPQSGAPLARCGVAAATTRTDVGPGEQARAGFANSGTWSGSSDTQLRRPACAALTSGGLSSAAVGRAYLRTCKRRWVLQRSSPMRKWRRVACGSTPRMLFGPSASSSLTMWHMKAGQHKRLPGVGIWVRPSK